ncbi:MAG: Lar family restriction alleviation protein [Gammaproteobacteria bacterium]|nr:Lar family restriction alleviation protein [Gammaproteobacteria bacterium]
MDEELKACPCPFCGDTPGEDAHTLTDGGFKYGAIQCGCGAIGPDVRTEYKDWPHWKDAAIREWNTRAQLPSQGGEAVAWHTDDHLTDKSATTYDREVAERWSAKGWPVAPLYTHPADQVADGVAVSRELLERIADPFTSTSNLIENLRDLRALLNGGRDE